jgi:hypothetical protein
MRRKQNPLTQDRHTRALPAIRTFAEAAIRIEVLLAAAR